MSQDALSTGSDFRQSLDSPFHTLAVVALVISLGILFGLFVPGIVAKMCDTFTHTGVRKRIEKRYSDLGLQLQKYDDTRTSLYHEIDSVEQQLHRSPLTSAQYSDIGPLVQLRAELEDELKSLRPPVAIVSFYLDDLMWVWPAFYISLGLLLTVLAPPSSLILFSRSTLRRTVLISLILTIMWRWPTWTRNFVLGNEGRVIYADANFDVCHVIFFVQEFLALINSVLLAVLWQQWTECLAHRRDEEVFKGETALQRAFDDKGARCLALTFIHWQICSIVLACAFIPYTHLFWTYIFRDGDSRYIVHAVIVHAVWLASWILISLPLLVTWWNWRAVRAKAMAELVTETMQDRTPSDNRVTALLGSEPIPGWNAIGSIGASVAVFVGPAVHAILS